MSRRAPSKGTMLERTFHRTRRSRPTLQYDDKNQCESQTDTNCTLHPLGDVTMAYYILDRAQATYPEQDYIVRHWAKNSAPSLVYVVDSSNARPLLRVVPLFSKKIILLPSQAPIRIAIIYWETAYPRAPVSICQMHTSYPTTHY